MVENKIVVEEGPKPLADEQRGRRRKEMDREEAVRENRAKQHGGAVSAFKKEVRRAKRYDVRVPLLISSLTTGDALDKAAGVAEEISRTGLRLHCWHTLRPAMFVRLGRPDGKETKLARVIWSRPVDGDKTLAGLAFSMALRNPGDFWGIDYPKSDEPETLFWQEALPGEEEVEVAQAEKKAPVEEAAPVKIPASGVPVLVRGVSSSRTPFQEETELKPMGNNEGIITVSWVMDEGRLLHIVLFEQERVLRARVSGYAKQAVRGKHRVWVRFEQPVETEGEISAGKESGDPGGEQ